MLDLRNNGGGLFPAGVQLGRLLMEKEDIVLIADSQVGGTAAIISLYDGIQTPFLISIRFCALPWANSASTNEHGAVTDSQGGQECGI